MGNLLNQSCKFQTTNNINMLMQKIISSHSVALAVGAFILASTTPGHSASVVYEGFDGYTVGTTISGGLGGSGWAAAWATGSGAFIGTNVAGSLGYTDAFGDLLQTAGGSIEVGSPAGNGGTTASPNRTMPINLSGGTGTTPGAGGTYWISFLYQKLNLDVGTRPYFRQSNFGLFQGTSERMAFGGPNTSATVNNNISLWGNAGPSGSAPLQADAYPITQDTTFFMLMKVGTDGTTATDTAYVWVNWTDLLTEPDNSAATLVDAAVDLSGVNTFRFQAGNMNANGSNAWFRVDELRVGTTFSDVSVVPEPGSVALIVFGGFALIATVGRQSRK